MVELAILILITLLAFVAGAILILRIPLRTKGADGHSSEEAEPSGEASEPETGPSRH
jgi:hypothetical protein